MSKSIFSVNPERLFESESFASATADELRVLVAVLASNAVSEDELASISAVSKPRCLAALALFEAEGIVVRSDAVTEEFEGSISSITDAEEDSAVRVARDIRDSGLATLIAEFAMLMKKPALSTAQVKKIVSLYTNYALSEEYILYLASDLAEQGKLSVTRLATEAISLVERGIDTADALCAYLEERKNKTAAENMVRNILGFYGRKLSKSEKEYFNKWVNEFGYSKEIIEEAFDINTSHTEGKVNLGYMDAILSRWHECGCKTLAQCIAASERDRATIAAEKKKSSKSKKTSEKTKPKYAAFSAEDALMRALERSYGTDK